MATATRTAPKKKTPAPESPDRERERAAQMVIQVAVDKIELDDKNARDAVTTPADKEKFAELVASVKIHGVLQPICLYDPGHPARKQAIVYGHRRLMAAIEAGLKLIPATILDHAPDAGELQAMRWEENQQRLDLNPIEKAVAVEHRVDAFGGDVTAAARAMGWTEKQVRDQLYLKRLAPKVRALVIAGKINAGQARELVKVPAAADQEQLGREVTNHGIDFGEQVSIEELRDWIADLQRPLDKAQWKLELPFAGKPACVGCPNNTDSDVDLFGEKKGEPRCTLQACYDVKVRAVGAANDKALAKVKQEIKDKRILVQDAGADQLARNLAAPFVEPKTLQRFIKAQLPAAKPAADKAAGGKGKKEPEKKGPTELQRRQAAILKWAKAVQAWKNQVGTTIDAAAAKHPGLALLAIALSHSELPDKHSYHLPHSEHNFGQPPWKNQAKPVAEKIASPELAGLMDHHRGLTYDGLLAIAQTFATNQIRIDLFSRGPDLTQRLAAAFAVACPPPPAFEDYLPKDLQPPKKDTPVVPSPEKITSVSSAKNGKAPAEKFPEGSFVKCIVGGAVGEVQKRMKVGGYLVRFAQGPVDHLLDNEFTAATETEALKFIESADWYGRPQGIADAAPASNAADDFKEDPPRPKFTSSNANPIVGHH